MRNCLFVVLLAGLISACTSSGKPDNIVVTFDVKNPTATEVVLVYHRTINSVPLNEQGYGADTISGVNALYANLFYGQNERKIYLEKGCGWLLPCRKAHLQRSVTRSGERSW